ncbi:MAG: DUF6266 family protein [Paludibacter sp.]|jgi:Family of unknown function (DUF6266)
MGKLVIGILGGFSGTVGTVVGSTNKKGDDIIRAKTKRPRTSNTEGQANQRTKFGLVTAFMQAINFILKFSFKQVAGDTMSSYNYACQYALKNAITGQAPDFELDYSKVLISEGQLSRETTAGAELVDGKVNFHWEDNSSSGNCASTDKAVLLVYNVDQSELSYSMGAITRGMKAGSLPLPYNETGDSLLFYLFFQSASDETLVSSSHFLGNMVIA